MKKILFASLSIALLAVSCSKSSDDVAPIADSYMTLTAGSVWNYDKIDLDAGGTVTPYTLTSTTRDSSILGTPYHVFINSDGNTTEYYNVSSDNEYRVYQDLPAILGTYTKLIFYLDTDFPVGTAWDQNLNVVVNGFAQTLNLSNHIIEKDVSRVVNGTTFNKVICVKTDYSYTTLGPNYFNGYTKSYYAPKYGLIEDSTKFILLPLLGPPYTAYFTQSNKLTSAVLQ